MNTQTIFPQLSTFNNFDKRIVSFSCFRDVNVKELALTGKVGVMNMLEEFEFLIDDIKLVS